jgi:RHS repeat-associated protein
VQTGSVPTFGVTGELHDGAAGLVNLRARWYNTRAGTFTAVDPFVGFAAQPYSQHPYQYAYSNPVRWTDPSGQCVFVGLDTVACAGVAIVFLVAAGVTTWATYDACITRGGCAQLQQDILAWQAQGNRFDTGGVPVPVLSAPHGAPQPAPTPVPFPAPTEQPRPIAVFPDAQDCPPVVVQPGPVAQQPTPVISADPLPTPGARGPVVLTAIPSGFRSSEDFVEFGKTLYTGLRAAGFDDAEAFMQGSAVTGGFNVQTSDFDVAVASTEAFVRALDGGLSNYYKRDPERLGPIKVGSAEAAAFGVETLLLHLSQQYGREVNLMFYPSAAEVYKRRSYPIPDADQ